LAKHLAAVGAYMLERWRAGADPDEVLNRALWRWAEVDGRPRCSEPERYCLWVSDNPSERQQAVELCNGCPVLGRCVQAAADRSESAGVWGAVDWTRR
jgi:Transcription factor WhiB